jgi:nucleoside-diphosphate-sugar epimerase
MKASVQFAGVLSRSGLDDGELAQLIRSLEPQLRALVGASILVTGATGWFGTWLLDVFCAADVEFRLGIKIAAVSRDPARFLDRFHRFTDDPRITWIKSDVRQLEPTIGIFSHVIHAATDTSIGAGELDALRLFETITDGTRCTLAAAGTRCKSFLFISSGAVYGPARPNCSRFTEREPIGPDPSLATSGYAEGKRAAEQACAIAAGMGLPIRIARCFAFVGPHMPFNRHFAIGNFIADAVNGRAIRIKSDGHPQRSYLYMSDLVRALIAILVQGDVCRPYNVGSDAAITIEQLAHRVDRVVGGRGVRIDGAKSDPSDRYVPDTTRLRTELGWEPEVSLDAAIARTAAWYREKIRDAVPS